MVGSVGGGVMVGSVGDGGGAGTNWYSRIHYTCRHAGQ